MKRLILSVTCLSITVISCGLQTTAPQSVKAVIANPATSAVEKFVCRTDPAYGLNVRSGTGTEYESIDVIPNDTPVVVTQTNVSGWVAVVYNGGSGFVNDNYICER